MVATLISVWDRIETDWEATTPPNRTNVTYHRVTGKTVEDGLAADRSFWFEIQPDGRTINSENSDASYVVWKFLARLMLTAAGRGVEDLNEAVANEGNLLCRQVENRTAWPAGVWEVQPPRWRGQETSRTGDVVLLLEIEALCGEDD